MPGSELWFLDGRGGNGKTVSNPGIGYGRQALTYADGKTREFYQIGISANTSGISVYIMGLAEKTYLNDHYAQGLPRASVTGYCIKFEKLNHVDMAILGGAIIDGLNQTKGSGN
jgi:hypothetical protein